MGSCSILGSFSNWGPLRSVAHGKLPLPCPDLDHHKYILVHRKTLEKKRYPNTISKEIFPSTRHLLRRSLRLPKGKWALGGLSSKNDLCFCSGLCRNEDLHRHVVIVFLPN